MAFVGVLLEEVRVHPARALVLTDAAQDHGRDIAVGRIAWVRGEQALGLGEGARGVVQPVEEYCELVACGRKARRELECTVEEVFRVHVAANAHGDLGQHADRRHVGRCLHQVRLEERLGDWNVVPDHRQGRALQHRMAGRRADMPGIGGIGACGIAGRVKVFGEQAPRLRMGGSRSTVFRRAAIASSPRPLRAQGRGQQEERRRMLGYDLEYLARLLGGECRLPCEQLFCVRERYFQRSGRARIRIHLSKARPRRAMPSWMSGTV